MGDVPMGMGLWMRMRAGNLPQYLKFLQIFGNEVEFLSRYRRSTFLETARFMPHFRRN
jgi:hypothetical protein